MLRATDVWLPLQMPLQDATLREELTSIVSPFVTHMI